MPLFFICADERFDVVTHQIKLMLIVFIGWVDGDFGGRQSEDQPSLADVDVRQLKHVPQERAVGLRILAVNDGMGSGDHAGAYW